MLDDKNQVAQRDPQDLLGFIATQPTQLGHDFGIAGGHMGSRPIYSVVFAGMGGSSLAAELALSWPQLAVPFVVCREYDLPAFVNESTLVVCSSYSGNTEETLSALGQAQAKKAQLAIIAHGGKMAAMAKTLGCVYAQVPECPVPRASMLYDFRAFVEILTLAHLVPGDTLSRLATLVEPLSLAVTQWAQSVNQQDNLAKQLAHDMVGKTPIVYAGPKMFPAAYRWKIGINENAKNTSWCSQYSEVDHNEFMGWTSHPIDKPFAIIDLISRFEHPHIIKRFPLTDRLLSGMRPHAITVEAQGETALEHMLWLSLLGDFASAYLGILNGVNPTQVDLAEKFKLELSKV